MSRATSPARALSPGPDPTRTFSFDDADERASLLPPHGMDTSRQNSTNVSGQATPVAAGYGATEQHGGSDGAGGATTSDTASTLGASVKRKRTKSQRRKYRKQQWEFVQKRSAYYVPLLEWLPNYTWQWFGGDVISALTLTCLLVPQAMSYASGLANLDPVNGLFAVAIPAVLYSVFGTCRQLSMGPEAALSLLVGQGIRTVQANLPHGPDGTLADHSQVAVAVATLICFEVGLITFILGLLRLGFLDCVLSRPLLRGFITAVGVVIFVEQLVPMLGLVPFLPEHKKLTTVDKALFIVEHLSYAHVLTALISLVALIVLIGVRVVKPHLQKRRKWRWVTYVPEVLVVVIVGTVLADVFNWDRDGVEILGKVSPGQVTVQFPLRESLKYFKDTINIALIISVVGYVDSIVAAKQAGSAFNYSVSPNRELVALGVANIGSSFVAGTIPSYGSITRSRLNANAGARTQMSTLLSGIFTLIVTYFLLGFLYYLPKCILAAIILRVVYSIIEEAPHDIKFFAKLAAWRDLGLMTMTFLLSIFWDLQVGIVVSILISLVLVVKQSSDMRITILGPVAGSRHWAPIEHDYDGDIEEQVPGLLVVRIREALTFANTGALKERLRRLELYGTAKHHPSDAPKRGEASTIIFDMTEVPEIDASALQILHEVVETYTRRHTRVFFTHVSPQERKLLEVSGTLDLVGPDGLQERVDDALRIAATRPAPAASTDDSV